MFEIRVSLGANRPIYRQIIDQVQKAAAIGELSVGESLPSVRQLSEQLAINHNTVAKAYSELVRQGVLESQHGRGVFVAKRRQVFSNAERKRRLDDALTVFLAEATPLDFTPEQLHEALAKRLEQMTAGK